MHNTYGLALKLNRLKEKSTRHFSQKDFISQCIKISLVPKGLNLTLKQTLEVMIKTLAKIIGLKSERFFIGLNETNCFIMQQNNRRNSH